MTHRSGDFMERVSIYHSVCLTYRWFYNSSVAFNISQIKCKLYLYKFYLFALYLSKNNLSERLNWKNVFKCEKVSVCLFYFNDSSTGATWTTPDDHVHSMIWDAPKRPKQKHAISGEILKWNISIFHFRISLFIFKFKLDLIQMLSFLDPIVCNWTHTLGYWLLTLSINVMCDKNWRLVSFPFIASFFMLFFYLFYGSCNARE